jgi:hypothetical protein
MRELRDSMNTYAVTSVAPSSGLSKVSVTQGRPTLPVAGAQNATMQATERSFIGRRIKGRRREGKVPPKPLRWC